MNSIIKQKAPQYLGLLSFFINYFPYLIFILLINREGSIISNVLPMAIFYAFRRTALFIFRDYRKNSNLLGWIGLVFALVGYLIGVFGAISDQVFDLAAVFIGSAAAIFPNALNQNKRQDVKKNKKGGNPLKMLLILLGSLCIFALISKMMPTLACLILFIASFAGLFAYKEVYGFKHLPGRVHFNWPNLVLVCFLLFAMFLMERGRSQNIGNMVKWGVFLLVAFLIVLMLILIFDRKDHFVAASKKTYFQISMYGVCAMFWITYSAILITITHGVGAFYFVFLSYLSAIILAKPAIKLIFSLIPGNALTINSLMIIIGLICTFWFPSYFVGVFLIRVFANHQKQLALKQYEEETGNHQDSYFLSYYLSSLSAFWTQTIMWTTLIICCRPAGFEKILRDITFHQLATDYLWSINLTHIVLALVMFVFVLITYLVSNKKQRK